MYKQRNEAYVQQVILRLEQDKTTREIAAQFGPPITCADVSRAAHGIFPKGDAKRAAFGLPPICISCGRKVIRVRHVPDWVNQAVENLQKLEAAAGQPIQEQRVYARGGKRVLYVR